MSAGFIALLPEPKIVSWQPGQLLLTPASGAIAISSAELFSLANSTRSIFPHRPIHISLGGGDDALRIELTDGLTRDAYRLSIGEEGVRIVGGDTAGAFYAVQTLRQIAGQSDPGVLPWVQIEDEPDFIDRGLLYDVSRGRIPKLKQFFELADQLSHYKINQLQLYIEHTFAFRGHPDIGKGASPLTPEDILQLDAYCRERHIELIPCLATFGHLSTVLQHPQYHDLAEDLGVGKFVHPDASQYTHLKGWTLSPANPRSYEFLDSLFAEFLPLFSSHRFNACCDEVYDLGWGQSYELCRQEGKGSVYLSHVKRVAELAAKYGKSLMFWGDMIRLHPELISTIPKDFTVLDWGYNKLHNYEGVRAYKEAGLTFYACTSTASFTSLFPRLPEARENMSSFAAAGKKHGARGFLNTDWGDGGHYNFLEFSWPGYLFGAEQAWNGAAEQSTFTPRSLRCLLKTHDPALAEALDDLGDLSFVAPSVGTSSVWGSFLFAHPADEIFQESVPTPRMFVEDGQIVTAPLRLDAEFARKLLPRVEKIREVFQSAELSVPGDTLGLLPYWSFAARNLHLAVRKLAAYGPDANVEPSETVAIKEELAALRDKFSQLWKARNRPGGLKYTLAQYDRAIAGDCVRATLAEDSSGTLQLTLENAGERPATGAVKIQILPASAASLSSGKVVRFRQLPAGDSLTTPLHLLKKDDHFLVEATGNNHTIRGSSLAVYGNRRFELRALSAVPPGDVQATLERIPAVEIKSGGRTMASLRLAKCGSALALGIRVEDAAVRRMEPVWRGSCVEIFGCPLSGTSADIAQVFLVPACGEAPAQALWLSGQSIVVAPGIELNERSTPERGYVLTALIPLPLLNIPLDTPSFRLEIITTATMPGETEARRASLFFGAETPSNHPDGFGIITTSQN